MAVTIPSPRRSPFHEPDIFREMREQDRLTKVTMWDGNEVWYVTRHEDARFVLRDSRFSVLSRNGLPELTPGRDTAPGALGRTDEPRHRELRRMLADEFLVKRIDAMRPSIERTVATQVEQLLSATPPVDFHTAFSMGIPAETIGTLLGAPPEVRKTFRQCLDILTNRTASVAQRELADQEMYSCCRRLVEQKLEEPGDDVISRCMAGPLRDGRMHPEEAYRTTVQMVAGGHETTSATITLGTLTMLVKPEWRRTFRDKPEAVPDAVEELLRFHAPQPDGMPRVALEDVVVGGTQVSAGDGLLVCVASANRDERMFERPDELEVERDAARRHLTFGHGTHRCIGQWLARAEIQIALRAVATELPTLRLAVPFEQLAFKEDSYVAGVRELPVSW